MSDYSYIDNPDLTAMSTPWVAKDGSIFTAQPVRLRCPSGKTIKVAVGIAYNVGPEMAEHLVRLHNNSLPCFN
jgi:hypothetical protein